MARIKSPPSKHDTPPLPTITRIVDPNAVYLKDEFRRLFGVSSSTLGREVREGRLRVAKRVGRYFLLGEWILEWIRSGELPRRSQTSDAERSGQRRAGR